MKTQEKKVLFVTPYFYPHVGGAENYAFQIAKGLSRNFKWKIVVVTSNEINKKFIKEKIFGFSVYRLPSFFKISNTPVNPMWIYDLQKIISQEQPDIINAHAPVPFIADIAAMLAGKIPFVLTYHSGPMTIEGSFVKNFLIQLYEKLLLPQMAHKASAIISSSDYVKKSLFAAVKKKVVTITPGVDTKLFKPGGQKKNSILFVGNLNAMERYKGLELLLKSFSQVVKKNSSYTLTVVGEGNYLTAYKRIVSKSKLQNYVHFTGKLWGRKLIRQYQQARLLVHPTSFDSFPLVLLEALSCKTPVVSTTVGGIPEIIQNSKNGLLIPPNSLHALTNAIASLTYDTKRVSKMGEFAHREVVKNYDWKVKVAETNKLFLHL